jgi:hypothetical protein
VEARHSSKDQEVILVELGKRAFEREFAACDLQALDEIAGAHEQHAPSILDECEADGCRKMALAAAGRPEQLLVELGKRAFEREFAACDLQALDEIAGAHEQHAQLMSAIGFLRSAWMT